MWTYDDAGNITYRTEYAYTTGTLGVPTDTVTYTYGDSDWGDTLTAYNYAETKLAKLQKAGTERCLLSLSYCNFQ